MGDLKKAISATAKKAAKIEAKAAKLAERHPVVEKPAEVAQEVIEQKAGSASGFEAGRAYVVRRGCAITSRRGVISAGERVKPQDLAGGVDSMRRLVEESGILVEAE